MEKKTQKKETKTKNKESIENLKKEIEELKNENLLLRADFDNFRKRKEKETTNIRENSINNFIVEILPTIDMFELSLKQIEQENQFTKGVELIHKNLINILKQNNCTEFLAKTGETFDPTKHEPLLIESDKYDEGKIVDTLNKGYIRNQKILRAAKVYVSKKKEKN